MSRDNYMGFEISYSTGHEGYRVMSGDVVMFETASYDTACEWIENKTDGERK